MITPEAYAATPRNKLAPRGYSENERLVLNCREDWGSNMNMNMNMNLVHVRSLGVGSEHEREPGSCFQPITQGLESPLSRGQLVPRLKGVW